MKSQIRGFQAPPPLLVYTKGVRLGGKNSLGEQTRAQCLWENGENGLALVWSGVRRAVGRGQQCFESGTLAGALLF